MLTISPRRWETAVNRAWRDTITAMHGVPFWGTGVLVSAPTATISGLVISEDLDWSLSALLGAGIAIAIGLITVAVWYIVFLILAPRRQRDEARREIDEIEAKRRSPFVLTPRHGVDPHTISGYKMWAFVDVLNDSDVPAVDVELFITDLMNDLDWDQQTGGESYQLFAIGAPWPSNGRAVSLLINKRSSLHLMKRVMH